MDVAKEGFLVLTVVGEAWNEELGNKLSKMHIESMSR